MNSWEIVGLLLVLAYLLIGAIIGTKVAKQCRVDITLADKLKTLFMFAAFWLPLLILEVFRDVYSEG